MSKTTDKKTTVAQAAKASQRRVWLIAAVVVVLVGVAAVIAVASGTSKDPAAESDGIAQVRPVTITGTPLDVMPDGGGPSDPGLNKKPPELTGQTFDGQPISIVPGGGRKLVIFLAHWCPHCRAEVPRIVEWMNAGQAPEGLKMYAVSTAVNKSPINYPPSKWLETEKFTIPTLADDAKSSAAAAWGLPGYPYLVMLRADGTVAARTSGEFTDVAALNTWVQQAIAL